MADDSAFVSDGSSAKGVTLNAKHVLGARPTTGRTVEHVHDDEIAYLAGKRVAFYRWEEPQHDKFLPVLDKGSKTSEIITFCVSPNRRYIALAERQVEGSLQVNIYSIQSNSKLRTLEFKYLSKRPVVTLCFSTDNKYLATVTAFPEVYIYLWQVDKARLIGMIDVPYEITRVTVSPWDYQTLATTGPTSFKLWTLTDKQLKPTEVLPRRGKDATAVGGVQGASYRFTCHCWYDDKKLVAGTEEGDMLVVEGVETRRIMRTLLGDGMAITSIQAIARGLLVGGDGGVVALYERAFDDAVFFNLLRRISVGVTSRVTDISVAPKEDNAVVFFRNNQMVTIALENVEVQRESVPSVIGQAATAAQASAAQASQVTSPLMVGFHEDEVTAVDVCVQKPLIATGSADKTVRVWNFMRYKLEFAKQFDEEVLSLALHPTGLRMLIGFKSYMRMYNVLANDLHFCYEFSYKACSEVRFSNGGQMFAAVSAHRINITNTYDFACAAQLGHPVHIKSITWGANDRYIIASDLNGSTRRWDIDVALKPVDSDDKSKTVAPEHTILDDPKNLSYTCCRIDDAQQMIACTGTCRVAEAGMAEGELSIRVIMPGASKEVRVVRLNQLCAKPPSQRKSNTAELALSTVAKTLFVGTPSGSLHLYRWPLLDDAQPYRTYDIHSAEITYVVLSRDDRFLFTVGADHTMYMFDVDAVLDGKSIKPFNYSTFEDVVYVLQADMDDRAREAAHLQAELEELAVTKQRDEQALIHKYEVERANKEDEAQQAISYLQKALDDATKEKEGAEKQLSDNARELEAHNLKAAEDLEALYTKRSEESNARYQQLKTERDDLVVRYENQLFKLQKEQEGERKRLEDKLRETETRLGLELEHIRQTQAEQEDAHKAMLDQCIVDYETMVDELSSRHKTELTKTQEQLSRAINNSSTGERDADRLRKEKDLLDGQLKDRSGQVGELQQVVDKRQKENDSLRNEMYVRFESISIAEKKIQQLKKQTSELEKLRYVLTFKFNELKKEVAPKDKQIAFLTQRVEEMDTELEKVALDREGLKQALERKEDRLQVLQREIRGQNQSLEDRERVVAALLRDLSDLVAQADHKRLVHQLKDVVTKFGSKQSRIETAAKEDRTAEFERQREYMESQLSCIRRQNNQKEGNLRQENQRGTAENAILVKEINELRHEKKQLVTKCAMVEQQLKEARLALQRATTAAQGGAPAGSSSAIPASPSPGLSSSAGGRDSAMEQSASGLPSRRGRLVRGPTRALRDVQQLDADKIARIIAQVERNNAEMERQQEEIERLRDFVGHLLARAESERQLSETEKQRHAEIRRHLDAAVQDTQAAASVDAVSE